MNTSQGRFFRINFTGDFQDGRSELGTSILAITVNKKNNNNNKKQQQEPKKLGGVGGPGWGLNCLVLGRGAGRAATHGTVDCFLFDF